MNSHLYNISKYMF